MSLPDVKAHDAWTQGVKCSHPEADAADSEESYPEIKKRVVVRWRSGGILYPSCASRQVAAQGASGRFFDPPCRKRWDFLPPLMIARKLSAWMNRGRYRLAHFEQGELRSRSELFTPSATQGGDFVPP